MPEQSGTPSEQDVASRVAAMNPQEYQRLIGSHPILSMMVRAGLPLTRDNYVDIANAGRPDEAWTAEHEANLPSIFRDAEAQG
jgi:hypothetical protein